MDAAHKNCICVHRGQLYAKAELFDLETATKFRFCVHLGQLYAKAELFDLETAA
jgi:hypothetical protein